MRRGEIVDDINKKKLEDEMKLIEKIGLYQHTLIELSIQEESLVFNRPLC